MQLYSLEIDEFLENDYHLIGVHSTLEDYQLAFFLNKNLKIKLTKATYNLDFKNTNACYSVFEYINEELDYSCYLIANIYKSIATSANTGFFKESETITYLIPEKKTVDYFLKITGNIESGFIEKNLEKINAIPQIITSYKIKTNTLKSKDFLIF